jgi:hypothetical protein
MGIWRNIFICKTTRIWGKRKGQFGMQVEEDLVCPKSISKVVVFEV